MMIVFCIVFLLLSQFTSFSRSQFSQQCQTGLREDNNNYIYCVRQNVTQIPKFSQSGAFSSSIIYDEIVLSENLINSINSDSFGNNLKVRKLYLDQNPIRYIDKDAFNYLKNYLEEIYFDYGVNEKANEMIVSTSDGSSYETVNSAGTTTDTDSSIFKEAIFDKCVNLRILSIKNYNIKRINGLSFVKMTKLNTLTISNSNLQTLDNMAFVGLENSLVELNLDLNYLDKIPTKAIQRLKRLRKLNLALNRIKIIQSNAFFKLSSLQTLDLSYNQVSKFELNAFSGPMQNTIKYLYLQNNELKWVHFIHLLYNLRNLNELNVDFNKLNHLNDDSNNSTLISESDDTTTSKFGDIFLQLNSLSLQDNKLNEMLLTKLTHAYSYEDVSTTENGLTRGYNAGGKGDNSLNMKRFRLNNLKKLNLARNKITKIPSKFFQLLNMSQLESLTLDRNPMSYGFSDGTFNGLEETLHNLSLTNVGFRLQDMKYLFKLNNLVRLKLSSNDMSSSNNNDEELMVNYDDNKRFFDSIVSLDMLNNNLDRLPSFICKLKNLNDLDLSSNRLSTINETCLSELLQTSLKQINLNNNPLRCDCGMKYIRKWLENVYDKDLLEFVKWECVEPKQAIFTDLAINQFICSPIKSTTTTTTTTTTTSRTSTTTTTTTTTTSSSTSTYEFVNTPKILFPETFNGDQLNIIEHQFVDNSHSLATTTKKYEIVLTTLSYYYMTIGLSLGFVTVILSIVLLVYALCTKRLPGKNKNPKQVATTEYSDRCSTSSTAYSDSTLKVTHGGSGGGGGNSSEYDTSNQQPYYHDFCMFNPNSKSNENYSISQNTNSGRFLSSESSTLQLIDTVSNGYQAHRQQQQEFCYPLRQIEQFRTIRNVPVVINTNHVLPTTSTTVGLKYQINDYDEINTINTNRPKSNITLDRYKTQFMSNRDQFTINTIINNQQQQQLQKSNQISLNSAYLNCTQNPILT